MFHNAGRSLAILLAAAALPAAAQPSAECPVEGGVQDIYGKPLLLQGIASGKPVSLAPDAILALEKMQYSTLIWRTDQPFRIARTRLLYPAKSQVTALRTDTGARRCLRDATADGDGLGSGHLMPCLVDGDGDGRFETAHLFREDAIITTSGKRSKFKSPRIAPVEPPVGLTEDPNGLGMTREYAFRRLRVTALAGATARVASEIATQAASDLPAFPGLRTAGGKMVVPAQPRSPGVLELPPEYQRLGATISVPLADGEIAEVDGLRLRVTRTSDGWTMTPLSTAFPAWIHIECEGARLRLGAN
jgi:hypothetical protein